MPKYLLKNGHGIYHFRLAVPKHLRHIFRCREIKRSLQTRDIDKARHLAGLFAYQYKQAFTMAKYDQHPLGKELKFGRIKLGDFEAENVEIDPDNIEADTRALLQIIQTAAQHQPAQTTKPDRPEIRLKDLINEYLDNVAASVKPATVTTYRPQLLTLLEILGNVPISSITRQKARAAADIIKRLPANREKKYPGKSIREILAIDPAPEPLATRTARLYIERASALFTYAIQETYTDFNPFTALKPKQPTRPQDERKIFTNEEIAALFSPNNLKYDHRKPSRYWIPLIAAYTGMRLEEICQLETTDIQHLDGIPCISINDTGGKQLKNQTAARLVPIHTRLIRLGFIDFASQQQGRLFPELTKINGKRGHSFSKWFARYRKQCGITGRGKTFHSFRHTVATLFKRADIEETKAAAILGHTINGETYGRYGKEYRPEQLRAVIEVISY